MFRTVTMVMLVAFLGSNCSVAATFTTAIGDL